MTFSNLRAAWRVSDRAFALIKKQIIKAEAEAATLNQLFDETTAGKITFFDTHRFNTSTQKLENLMLFIDLYAANLISFTLTAANHTVPSAVGDFIRTYGFAKR